MRTIERSKKGGVKERRKPRTRSEINANRRHTRRRVIAESVYDKMKIQKFLRIEDNSEVKTIEPASNNKISTSLLDESYTSKELITLYMKYPSFRRTLESGDFILYRNHIHLASKEVQELVVKDWIESVVKGLSLGGGDDDDGFDPEKVNAETSRLMEMMDCFFKEPHISFSEALQFVMKFLNVSGAKLSNMTGISTSTISKMLHEDKYNTPMHEEKTIVTICLALRVPPMISEELLRLAGCPLSKSNELHRAYLILLNFFYLDGLKVCNNFLIARKLPRIVN